MSDTNVSILWEAVNYIRVEEIKKAFPNVNFIDVSPGVELDQELRGEIFLVTPTRDTAELPKFLDKGVKWVHIMTHGVDGLPFEMLGDCVVTCSRGASSVPIAEWAVTMILSHTKKIPESWISEEPENWFLAPLETLSGATVALLGFGSINQEIAKRLEPFGCRIVAVRNNKSELSGTNIEILPTLEEGVSEADHVVIGLPLTEETHHIVNDRLMKLMKPGAHLVNIARGDIVDQEALFENLESGQISRASLDVVSPEPLPEGHWLYTDPRVKLSAHISWASPDFLDQLHHLFSSNLKKWLSGLPLDGLVDVKKGY
ncbi:MAG: NAD(P)-binding domain-containing protein [Acidimicrobiales bacterium]|nr:NAD(P)-binding domain-containing protein [Acidimicrobiales bacterium]